MRARLEPRKPRWSHIPVQNVRSRHRAVSRCTVRRRTQARRNARRNTTTRRPTDPPTPDGARMRCLSPTVLRAERPIMPVRGLSVSNSRSVAMLRCLGGTRTPDGRIIRICCRCPSSIRVRGRMTRPRRWCCMGVSRPAPTKRREVSLRVRTLAIIRPHRAVSLAARGRPSLRRDREAMPRWRGSMPELVRPLRITRASAVCRSRMCGSRSRATTARAY